MVVCAGLFACNRHSHPNVPEAVEQSIGMSPASVAATRTLISDTEDLQAEGFIVYGYKETPSNGTQVFSHQAVNYNGGWNYTPTRYWDRAAAYHFGAYSPQHITTTHIGTGKSTHTIAIETPYWQMMDGSETDIIVATSHGSAEDYLTYSNGIVDLHFEHILSQLEVQFVHNPFLMNEYRLHTVAYKDVPVTEGVGTYVLDYTTPQNSSMGTIAMLGTADSVAVAADDAGIIVSAEVAKETTFKHLVIPFSTASSEGIQIGIGYSVSGAVRYAVVHTKYQTLEAGKRYVLKLTFNSGAEIIPEMHISDWVDEEIDENDKYNW